MKRRRKIRLLSFLLYDQISKIIICIRELTIFIEKNVKWHQCSSVLQAKRITPVHGYLEVGQYH